MKYEGPANLKWPSFDFIVTGYGITLWKYFERLVGQTERECRPHLQRSCMSWNPSPFCCDVVVLDFLYLMHHLSCCLVTAPHNIQLKHLVCMSWCTAVVWMVRQVAEFTLIRFQQWQSSVICVDKHFKFSKYYRCTISKSWSHYLTVWLQLTQKFEQNRFKS